MVYNFNGRVSKANKDDHRDFRFVWSAGHVNGSIYYAIITGSPNMAAAVDFLRFLAQPEQQAGAAMIAPYGPLNLRSPALLDKALAEHLPSSYMDTAVDQDDADYVAFWLDKRDALYERFAAWQAQ
jgi:putative spermidine/putrescine transport system substrate-binding protein